MVFPLFVTEVTVRDTPGPPLDDEETNEEVEPPPTPPSSLNLLEITPPPYP